MVRGRKPAKKPKKHYRVLNKNEVIKEAKKRNLYPVNVGGFVTLADTQNYYENSYPNKQRYKTLTWEEFFKSLESRNLIVKQDINSGYLKIVHQRTINKEKRYLVGE